MNLKNLNISADAARPVPHGDDMFRYPGKIKANFSSNVWPCGTPAALKDHLAASLIDIGSYPPPHSETVTARLAHWLKIRPEAVLLTNGTAEAIYLVAQAFAGEVSRIVVPTFSEYEHACHLFDHHTEFIQETVHYHDEQYRCGLFWICNPNNPTGKIVSHKTILEMVASNPACCFVVDEAYQGLADGVKSLTSEVMKHPNLLVLRSLTKTYAVPGIRVGYIAGHPELIRRLALFQPPWSVNALALRVVEYAIEHRPFSESELQEYLRRSQYLQSLIANIPECHVHPSEVGYFVVRTPRLASQLKQQLIDEEGILIRDASTFRGLSEYDIRIATQNNEKNQLLVNALRRILSQPSKL